MSYLVVDNFNLGIDRKRPIYASAPGALWDAKNCHISRGGDIEKRKAFVRSVTLPSECFGLCAGVNTIYTFGSAQQPSMPTGYTYRQCQHPTNPSTYGMTQVLSSVLFDGKPYCIAKFSDGNVYHYYDGNLNAAMQNAGSANKPPKVGTVAYTFRSKIYSLAESLLEYSGINLPLGWTIGTDAKTGYINLATQFGGSSNLTGIDVFQGNLALFAERAIQIWYIREDDAQNYQLQTLRNTGTVAPRSVLAYGDIDVFYLDYTGIRSIRARVPSNAAFINDIGTSIDSYVRDWRDALSESVVQSAIAVIEPLDARFWMIIGSKIFVLSYFPASNIAAWTTYEISSGGMAFEVTDAVAYYDKVVLRSVTGDIYIYGGDSGQEYDDCSVSAQLPFLTATKPDSQKTFTGIDISCKGDWHVDVLVDPNDLTRAVHIGDLSGVTTNELANAGTVVTTHAAPYLTNSSSGYASVSQIMLTMSGVVEGTN